MTAGCGPRPWRPVFVAALLALALVVIAVAAAHASSPFGVGRPDPGPSGEMGALSRWLALTGRRFYDAIAGAVRAAKQDGSAAITLAWLAFAYGVFHAAGPGHGKAVISSYLFASGDTLRRGLMLAAAFALMQAVSAIAIVTLVAALLGRTAASMDNAAQALEYLSNGAIALFGAWLLWRKGRELWGLVAARFGWPGAASHVHGPDCGHIPLPGEIENARRTGLWASLIAGLRPCTGAIFVLVFAYRQDIYAAGILATLAMSLGTALTVAAIATIAVGAKGLAVRLASPESFLAVFGLRLAETLLAALVLALGLALLGGTLALPAAN